jgi:superfamily I DNA and RNA helicase
VFLPDLDDAAQFVGTDRPADIIGAREDLEHLSRWIDGAVHFWEGKEPFEPLGSLGLSLIETIFCRSIEVRPLIAQSLHVEEELRIRLTEQQARVLRILGSRKRAVISGGAGTGKTLLAAEKARTLAAEHRKVLFLCYNRPLADALKRSMSRSSNVQVLSFHQLCENRSAQVRREHGRELLAEAAAAYPGADRFEVQMPFALALSNEVLEQKYDAIVVDEAQDFIDEYWFAIEELLKDQKEGALYIFNDPNQALYRRHANLPINDDPYYLTANCRNTSYIHRAAYRYFRGEQTDPPDIEGTEIIQAAGRSIEEQATQIARETSRLIKQEGVRPSQIAVLVLGRPKNQFYDALARHSLGRATGWSIEVHNSDRVLMDTVKRFKGLEAAIVFLWLPPVPSDLDDCEALYVGLSRAKSMVYIVGTESACDAVLQHPETSQE